MGTVKIEATQHKFSLAMHICNALYFYIAFMPVTCSYINILTKYEAHINRHKTYTNDGKTNGYTLTKS